jgi:hypothetical protein
MRGAESLPACLMSLLTSGNSRSKAARALHMVLYSVVTLPLNVYVSETSCLSLDVLVELHSPMKISHVTFTWR